MDKLISLRTGALPSDIGNKARGLAELCTLGYPVPEAYVLPGSVYTDLVAGLSASQPGDLLFFPVGDAALGIPLITVLQKAQMPAEVTAEFARKLDPAKLYAVRSSSLLEDLADYSFAGQYSTCLNVQGSPEAIAEAVLTCYLSLHTETVAAYLADNAVSTDNLIMSVVIQEMFASEVSGVAFTVNPITGRDREIVVEVAAGLGDDLVSGKVAAERYVYDWYEEVYREYSGRLLPEERLAELMSLLLKVQTDFGYPLDIEFAVAGAATALLQVRPITRIEYASLPDQWTTADFKDGGVSATVCHPYMWSLYEYIWEIEYREYLHQALLVSHKNMGKLGDMFFGKPFWNLSLAKSGMAKVPGYKERDFDDELGVAINYEGDGVTTALNPGTLANISRIYLTSRQLTKARLRECESLRAKLLGLYTRYQETLAHLDPAVTVAAPLTATPLETTWRELVFETYLFSEGTYFWQIFINTVGQSIYKNYLGQYVPDSAYLNLLIGLNDVSHLRPFADLWLLSRQIRNDEAALSHWRDTSPAELLAEYHAGEKRFCFPEFRRHLLRFGYHSERELDTAYPHYAEEPLSVIVNLQGTVGLADDLNPALESRKQRERHEQLMLDLSRRLRAGSFRRVKKMVAEMRTMLWWREEFRDISTKFYYVIRLYTLKLAAAYTEAGILETPDDINFLKIADIAEMMDGRLSREKARALIAKNRQYYLSFRNYPGENEIGGLSGTVRRKKPKRPAGTTILTGVGCNHGVVTGRARVISGLAEIGRLEVGDILVTKYTDTGWTSKFAILKGIITEYGGVLCHAATVSREYGLPCAVCVRDATQLIVDGATVTLDGATGEIIVH
jgi:pyruvate,water dikinase